jgi:hypothetical protein
VTYPVPWLLMEETAEPREVEDDQRRHRRLTLAPAQELGPEELVTVENVTNEEDDGFGEWSTVHRGKVTGCRKPSWLGRSKFWVDYEEQGEDVTSQAAMENKQTMLEFTRKARLPPAARRKIEHSE